MGLQTSKYKTFTKQVYNHIMDETNIDTNMDLSFVLLQIHKDDLLSLLLSKLSEQDKIKISFMVSIYSKIDDLDQSVSKVENNFINLSLVEFTNLGDRDVECNECSGDGMEGCGNCDGDGSIDCDMCDATGLVTCDDCGGDGEIDGEECFDCSGVGEKTCSWCGGDKSEECPDCGGFGETHCVICDGDGTIKSAEEYYDKNFIQYYTINEKVLDLPEDTILNQSQVDFLYQFNKEPYYEKAINVSSQVDIDDPQADYDGEIYDIDKIIVIDKITKF